MKTKTRLVLLLLLALAGCETTPKTVNGQRVKATKWIDGRVVYILEDDTTVMQEKAAEAKEAVKGVKIAPVK